MTESSRLARWWWRTPVWSRLLTVVGGGFVLVGVMSGVTTPAQPLQPSSNPVPVITTTAQPTTTTPTTSTTTATTTTTTTTTEAPPPPPPVVTTTYEPPPVETTDPPAVRTVTPGAFCAPEGAIGVTTRGTPMTCVKKPGEKQARWRAA